MRLMRTSSAIFPSFFSSHFSSTQTERSKPIRRLYGWGGLSPSEFAVEEKGASFLVSVISTPSVLEEPFPEQPRYSELAGHSVASRTL
jgi:hypothetical protein